MAEFLHEVVRKREGSTIMRSQRRFLPERPWIIRDNDSDRMRRWQYSNGLESNLYLSPRAFMDANELNHQAFDEFALRAPVVCTVRDTHRWVLNECYYTTVATHYFECQHCNLIREWVIAP